VSRKYEVITDEQAEQFLQRGFILLHDCFTRETAEQWISRAWRRLEYDPNNPATWVKPRVQMPNANRVTWEEFSPKAWAAAADLAGGRDRLEQPCHIADGFVINFGIRKDQPWQDPSPTSPGWHKDGDFFRHFLDSPEQGLLTLAYWTDVEPRGGGTFVACDSVGPVARYLAAHPEGTVLHEFGFGSLVKECKDFMDTTPCRVGDIYLLHPFILHAGSQNLSGKPRFLTNHPIHLKEPMNFNRPNPDEFSLIERAILRGLGVDRFDFKPTGQRGRVVSERERLAKITLEQEKKRLATAKG
jgi:hypothetical protein